MREELRASTSLDEAIDAVLRDMMAKQAPATLKARVLAQLGDEAIDRALRDLAARQVPPTLKARVMARLDAETAGTGRAREERWTLVRPLFRPALGVATAGLVVATALTVWLLRTPSVLGPGSGRAGQVASRLGGSGGKSAPGEGQRAQSAPAVNGRGSQPDPAVASVAARRSWSVRPPGVTRSARHTTTWPGAQSEDAAFDAGDPLAIRQLKVEPLSVSRIAIPPIEVTPVEIVPSMSDTAPNPPAEPGAESRTGG